MISQLKTRLRFSGTLDKQSCRFTLHQGLCRKGLIRQFQRGHPEYGFTGNSKRLAAAGDDLKLRTCMQELVCQLCAGLDEVFTIIKNEKNSFGTQIVPHKIGEWHALYFRSEERRVGKECRYRWL